MKPRNISTVSSCLKLKDPVFSAILWQVPDEATVLTKRSRQEGWVWDARLDSFQSGTENGFL